MLKDKKSKQSATIFLCIYLSLLLLSVGYVCYLLFRLYNGEYPLD